MSSADPFDGMLQSIQDLAGSEYAYTVRRMLAWEQIRKRFKDERARRHLTQEQVAERGHVDQSAISKIENIPEYRPYVDTFVNAVHGLGMPAAAFFADLEGLQISGGTAKNTELTDRQLDADLAVRLDASIDAIQTVIFSFVDRLQDLGAQLERARRQRRTPRKTHRKTSTPR